MTLIFFLGGVKRWDGKLCVPTEKSWLRPCERAKFGRAQLGREQNKIDWLKEVGQCFGRRSNLRAVRKRKKSLSTRKLATWASGLLLIFFGKVSSDTHIHSYSYSHAWWKLFFDVHSVYPEGYSVLKEYCKKPENLLTCIPFFASFFSGGSESFNDKRDFFYRELVSHHGRKTGEVNLKIDRRKLLESVSWAFYKLVKVWLAKVYQKLVLS